MLRNHDRLLKGYLVVAATAVLSASVYVTLSASSSGAEGTALVVFSAGSDSERLGLLPYDGRVALGRLGGRLGLEQMTVQSVGRALAVTQKKFEGAIEDRPGGGMGNSYREVDTGKRRFDVEFLSRKDGKNWSYKCSVEHSVGAPSAKVRWVDVAFKACKRRPPGFSGLIPFWTEELDVSRARGIRVAYQGGAVARSRRDVAGSGPEAKHSQSMRKKLIERELPGYSNEIEKDRRGARALENRY